MIGEVVWETVVIVLLLLLNGVFAMSEIAVVSARRARLQQRVDAGDRGARTALELAAAPDRFLATIQIGITLIGILAGAFGGATLAEEIADYVDDVPALSPYAEAIGVIVVVLAITYLSLVVGELAPKRVGLAQAERVAALMAPPMHALSRVAGPLVALLGASTSFVLRWLPLRTDSGPAVTEEEIRLMVREGAQTGVFAPGEQTMIDGVFRLHDQTVDTLMTPRREVKWIDADEPHDVVAAKVVATGHSRVPVARGSLDDVVGIVSARDVLASSLGCDPFAIADLIRPALFVPESMTAATLLERFRVARDDIAIVIDEFGGCEGLVTGDDIFAAIVGEMPSGDSADEPRVEVRDDGSWLVDGRLPIDRLGHVVGVDALPPGSGDEYLTVAGLVLTIAGRLPNAGDHFVSSGWRYEVVDMDGRRVDKVIISREGE